MTEDKTPTTSKYQSITICELETDATGTLMVNNSMDYTVPDFKAYALVKLCRETRQRKDCDGCCALCIVCKLMEVR